MFGYDWPRLHAALNDLPAALLVVAVLFDLAAALARRPTLRVVGFATMLAGAVGGILAVLSGLQAEGHIAHGEAVHEIMETHETLAFITLGIFAVLAVWRVIRERKMSPAERGASLALSIAGLGVLIATAALGGRLVFDHAAGVPTPVLEAELHERAEGHHHHGGEGEEADDHDHAAPEASMDSASASAAPAEPTHTHAPGTPPHQH